MSFSWVLCRLSITSCIYPLQRNDEIGGAAHGFFLKNFFQKFFCAFAKTHDADRFSGERGRKPYHPPLRTRREVNPSPEPEIGDVIEIEYAGEILETYPAQIADVYGIKVIEKNKGFTHLANDD